MIDAASRRDALAARLQRQAWFGLAATIVLSPFRARFLLLARPDPPVYGDFADLLLFWSDIALLLTIGAWVASLLARPRRLALGPRFLAWPVAGLLALAWLGVPFAVDPFLAGANAVRLMLLVALAIYVVNEVADLRRLVAPIAVMVGIQAAIGIAQVVVQHSLGLVAFGEHDLAPIFGVSVITAADGLRTLRAYGLTDHPNILGGLLAFALPLLGVLPIARARGERALQIVVFALGAAALLVTFSRSAWLALAIGLLVAAAMLVRLRDRVALRWLGALALAGAIAAASLAVAFVPALAARVDLGGTSITQTRPFDERGAAAKAAVDVFVAHPLLGVGLGTLPVAVREAQPVFGYQYQPASIVLLDVAAETGVLGALCYLAIVIAPWIALVRRPRRWTPALAAASGTLAGVTVVGLFDYYTWSYSAGRIWAWLVLGLWAVAWRSAATEPAGAG
jgi:O-antigen ligase